MQKPIYTDNSVVMARGKGVGAGHRGQRGGKGNICNNVNSKNKIKNIWAQGKKERKKWTQAKRERERERERGDVM